MNESISLQNHDGILIEGKITKLEKWELEVEITKPFRNWRNSYKMNEVEIRQGCLMVNEYEETGRWLLEQSFNALNTLDERFEDYLSMYERKLQQLDAIQKIPDQAVRSRLTSKIDNGYGRIELHQMGPYNVIFDAFIKTGKIIYRIKGMKFNNETLRVAVKEWRKDESKAEKEYGHISDWDTSEVTDMCRMFQYVQSFNQPLEKWDVSNVTDMSGMFLRATSFNQPLEKWDVSKVMHMSWMFSEAESFNQPLEKWDTSEVRIMRGMFSYAKSFNQPLEKWDVSQVINMSNMFEGASEFNQPLEKWDVSKVTDMKDMFIETVIMEKKQIEFVATDGVMVKGRITNLQEWFIEVAILEPYVGWTEHLSCNGPGRKNPSNFISRAEDLSVSLLSNLYNKMKNFDESLPEYIERYKLLLEEKEALKYIDDDEIRDSIDSKISDSYLPLGITFLDEEKFLKTIEDFIATGKKTYMPLSS
jgi:surface protein